MLKDILCFNAQITLLSKFFPKAGYLAGSTIKPFYSRTYEITFVWFKKLSFNYFERT